MPFNREVLQTITSSVELLISLFHAFSDNSSWLSVMLQMTLNQSNRLYHSYKESVKEIQLKSQIWNPLRYLFGFVRIFLAPTSFRPNYIFFKEVIEIKSTYNFQNIYSWKHVEHFHRLMSLQTKYFNEYFRAIHDQKTSKPSFLW